MGLAALGGGMAFYVPWAVGVGGGWGSCLGWLVVLVWVGWLVWVVYLGVCGFGLGFAACAGGLVGGLLVLKVARRKK